MFAVETCKLFVFVHISVIQTRLQKRCTGQPSGLKCTVQMDWDGVFDVAVRTTSLTRLLPSLAAVHSPSGFNITWAVLVHEGATWLGTAVYNLFSMCPDDSSIQYYLYVAVRRANREVIKCHNQQPADCQPTAPVLLVLLVHSAGTLYRTIWSHLTCLLIVLGSS